jgi:vancomycin resistance protein YoaR
VTLDDQGSTTFEPVAVELGIDPGRPGTRFSHTLAAEQLTAVLREGHRRAGLELVEIDPTVPDVLASDQRPTHLLGTFTTYHPAGQSRVHNIQRLADEVDGTIVLPGEQFSINGISGRRTCDGGYVPAGTIVRGELVDTCGGGTSQFGTTTFNAAYFAGVQLDQWKAHSWYISRYPMGREATLNYPELDVKFTNDTDALILVKTSYTPSSITVSLYGRPTATRVSATLGTPTNPRPPSTQVRHTNDLFEGQERVLQSAGGNGFSVRVVRTIERIDGSTETQNIDTTYLPQHRIVEREPGLARIDPQRTIRRLTPGGRGRGASLACVRDPGPAGSRAAGPISTNGRCHRPSGSSTQPSSHPSTASPASSRGPSQAATDRSR